MTARSTDTAVELSGTRIRSRDFFRAGAQVQLFFWPLVALAVGFQFRIDEPNVQLLVLESLLLLVLGVRSVAAISPQGYWSLSSLFLIVTGVFHLGLAPFWLFSIDPEFPRPSDYEWFHGIAGERGLLLVSLAISGLSLGNALVVALRSRTHETRAPESRATASLAQHYSNWGAAATLIGIAWWLWIAVTNMGLTFFLSSYVSFLDGTSSTDTPTTYYVIGIGVGLSLITGKGRLVQSSLIVFALFAVLAFFMGLRGEILFPIAIGAAVVAFRRSMPRLRWVLLGGVALLALVNAAKIVRQQGLGETAFSWVQASPLAAIGELGSTFRVVATVYTWHGLSGEPFRNGDTYIGTVARAVELVLSPSTRPPGSSDYRLMNVEILNRAGGIGGSAVAEAYHNFATLGVIVVFIVFGAVLAYFSRGTHNPTTIALMVVLAMPLFNHIRNSFVPVIPVFAVGLVFVIFIRFLHGILTKRPA